MNVSQCSEGFSVRGRSTSSMMLPLHSPGDHNGNALPIFSPSSCLGESPPESLQSMSSLSGGQTQGTLDYDVFEVTLMTTVMTKRDKMTDVISKWVPEEESDNDHVLLEKIQTTTELIESNDNSVSVYLDANSSEYHEDTWNDNANLITNSSTHGNNDDLSSRGINRRQYGSYSNLDSDSTIIPDDHDVNYEEEALFQSVSSEIGVQRGSIILTSSTYHSSDSFLNQGGSSAMIELHTEGTKALNLADVERSELVLEGRDVACPFGQPVRNRAEAPLPSEHLNAALCNISSSSSSANAAQDAKTVTSSPSEEAGRCAVGPKPIQPNTSQIDRTAKTKPTTATSPASKTAGCTVVKPSRLKAKRISKLGLKNVKARVETCTSPSPPKTPSEQNIPAPASGKRVVPWREEAHTWDVAKNQGSSAVLIRVAMVSPLLLLSAPSLPPPIHISVSEWGMANTMVSVHSSELGPLGWDAVTKHQLFLQKVSSKLVPSTRQQKNLTLKEGNQSAGTGSSARVRQSQSQCQAIPKSHTTVEQACVLASSSPTTSNSKPTINQQPASGLVGRSVASKLPVKGLPTNLSSSPPGINENNEATGKAIPVCPGGPAPTGTKTDEHPSRSSLLVGNQSTVKPLILSTAATTSTNTPSNLVTSANTIASAASKLSPVKSRTLSLQSRITATGLKAPTVTNHNTAKTAAANQTATKMASAATQGVTKQLSQYTFQRSGSVRLGQLSSTMDKNKPREAPAKPTNANSSPRVAAPAGENIQNQQQPPPDLVPDEVNVNASVTPVLRVSTTDTTNASSDTNGASGLVFKARPRSRSSSKSGKAGTTRAVVVGGIITAKQNQRKEQAEKRNQTITQLRKLLLQGNKRVEALATVIQHLFTEREEVMKQKRNLSLELANLRDELATSSLCCKHLHEEKEKVRVSLEEALKRLEEQHKEELVQLEDRLRNFYQTEWDKVHQTYQEEADKCRMLMEQQVEELKSQQEAERCNREVSHSQRMQSLKVQYETSIQELKMIQKIELENLEKTLKETETSLSVHSKKPRLNSHSEMTFVTILVCPHVYPSYKEKVSDLSAEKEALNEKLKAEEERRRRILCDKNVKDSHTMYLEQELESLKVVLEIKNNQLQQKGKKLMEMDKLVETNVKLEECLKKVQQENEDYRARMDKHAALSKQLSNEQAILQQTLQKESKVNKRLSMENEELLWKLHNGDLLASPRRLSPTSPFNSPRNSASFPTTAPLSPR
ncbi:hypothetical protein L3Q82_019220 [Scortum barcoo]|uniref:Uncharacterized protein n=1 Tax=Scortum barcoo TaxID=214431 RepID=A0ACB8VB90_9TELE|nr:hypothetical protein L3Q82_019220 [Scortum barcoo]